MTIIRAKKDKNYTVMNRTVLNDTRLSWRAKGIMAYMLSMPDDWVFHVGELQTHSTDRETSFRSGLSELKKYGYVKRQPIREGNRIERWETIVIEKPLQKGDNAVLVDSLNVEVEHIEIEHIEIEDVENQVLLNTDLELSTESILNTENNNVCSLYFEIISYLNAKTKSEYKHTTPNTRELIKARLNEGFTLGDFKEVIDKKTDEWLNNGEMCKYLRPETLFGNKFESYLNQKDVNNYGAGPEQNNSFYKEYNFEKERSFSF